MQFTSEWYAVPKGIVLYGPPGTGKSAISGSICKKSGIVLVTAPMAAGDLKKGIVGDSEKTINAIAMRAKLIPWELTGVLIDEIDSLAPDRKGKDSSNGSQDLQSVLLATLDGSKETPNLKIIATTNLLNKMDGAFLRRMEIQLFLGNPSKSSRVEWIKAKANYCQRDQNFSRVQRFVEDPEFKHLKDKMVNTTINFSADAYRKLLERFFHALLSDSRRGNLVLKDYEELMHTKIKEISKEMKIYLGRREIVDILKEGEELQRFYNKDQIDLFYSYTNPTGYDHDIYGLRKASKQVLVDLSSEKNKDVFQLGCLNQNQMSESNQRQFAILNSIYDDAIQTRTSIALNHYLYAIICFQHVKHQGCNQQAFNATRTILLGKKDTQRICQDWSPEEREDVLLHNYNTEEAQTELAFLEEFRLISKVDSEALFCSFLRSIESFYDQSTCLQTLHLLYDSSKYKKSWLPLILDFALKYDADIVKLIDNAFIINNSAYDDAAALSLINDVVEEIKNYNRAVVIFDLDSISLIRREYQSLKEDLRASSKYALEGGENLASFSYVLGRPSTFFNIIDLIKTAEPDGSCWFFAVSEHNKIVLDLKEALRWPKTQSVLDYEEEERQREKPFRCLNCNEIFTERQNKNEYKCGQHKNDRVVYEVTKKILSLKEAQKMIYQGS